MILNKNLCKVLFAVFVFTPTVYFKNISASPTVVANHAEQSLTVLNLPKSIVADLNQHGIQTLGELTVFFKSHLKLLKKIQKLRSQIVSLLNLVFSERAQGSVDEKLLKKIGDKYISYLHSQLSIHFNEDQRNSYTELMTQYEKMSHESRPSGADIFDRHFEELKVFLHDQITATPQVKVKTNQVTQPNKSTQIDVSKGEVSFESLELGPNIVAALNQNGIETCEQLSRFSLEQFDFIKGLREIKPEIIKVLQKHHLHLADYSESMMNNVHILSLPFRNLIIPFNKYFGMTPNVQSLLSQVFYGNNNIEEKEQDILSFSNQYGVDGIVTLQELLEKMIEKQAFDRDNLTSRVLVFENYLLDKFNISIDAIILEKHPNHMPYILDGFHIEQEQLSNSLNTKQISPLTGIEDLNLNVQTYNCLKRAGINTIEELCEYTDSEILKIPNMGSYRRNEVKASLHAKNLKLRDENTAENLSSDDESTADFNIKTIIPSQLFDDELYKSTLAQSISILDLNSAISYALTTHGIHTIEDLCNHTPSQIHKIKGIGSGHAYITQIKEALMHVGLNLKFEVNDIDIQSHSLNLPFVSRETVANLIYKGIDNIQELKQFLEIVYAINKKKEKKLEMHAALQKAALTLNIRIDERLLIQEDGYFEYIRNMIKDKLTTDEHEKLQVLISDYYKISQLLKMPEETYFYSDRYYGDNVSLKIYDAFASEYLHNYPEVFQNNLNIISQEGHLLKSITLETTISEFINDHNIPYKILGPLLNVGIKTIADLISMTPSELSDMDGFTKSLLADIEKILKDYKFSLKPNSEISPDSISLLKSLPKQIRWKLRTMGIVNISQIESKTEKQLETMREYKKSRYGTIELSRREAQLIINALNKRKKPDQKIEKLEDKQQVVNLKYEDINLSSIEEVPKAVSHILENNNINTLAQLISCTEKHLLTLMNQESVDEIKIMLQKRSLQLKVIDQNDQLKSTVGGIITLIIRSIGGSDYTKF